MGSSFGSKKEKAVAVVRLARLHFLIPGILLYILGVLLALSRGASFELIKIALGYCIFFFAHLSVSFSNDYFDRDSDRLATQTSLSGGSGVLIKHEELKTFALRFSIFLILVSITLASTFTILFDYPLSFLIFSIAGALLGWFYTAPPIKLAYRRLGELSTSLAAGFVMPGMGYFVVFGTIDIWFVLLSIPLCLYGLYFILTVELPDVEVDKLGGKINLLVLFDRKTGAASSLIATLGGTGIFTLYAIQGTLGNQLDIRGVAALSLIPLIGAFYGLTRNYSNIKETLNQVKLNFASMMSFLLLSDLYILLIIVT